MPYQEWELANQCAAPGCRNQLPEREPRQRSKTYNGEASPAPDGRSVRAQRLTCSAACRKRLQRERAGYRKPFRPCRFCGDLIDTYRGSDVRCPEDDRSEACDEAQFTDEERLAVLEARRAEPQPCEGPGCANVVIWSGRGRPKTTCSARCRQRVRRARLEENSR